MKDVVFALPGIALTILCWGVYGPVLHKGQVALNGDRLKPLLCVGLAYFIIAVLIPIAILVSSGKLSSGWSARGTAWSMAAGTAGAVGALGIVLAFYGGGKPTFVMPLVFGGAPLVNVLLSMYFAGVTAKDAGNKLPFFLAGAIMIGIGAFMVLFFAPKGHGAPSAPSAAPAAAHAAARPANSGSDVRSAGPVQSDGKH